MTNPLNLSMTMNRILTTLALVAMSTLVGAQTYVTNTVPGGEFNPTDANYSDITNTTASGGSMVFDFPAAGGNPDGYARITDNSGGSSWGVWVIGATTPIALEDLGLSNSLTYTFLLDMKIESGANIGGLKVESWGPSGQITPSSGDMRPVSGTTNWATYSFTYTINPGATGLKFVGLWGPGSTVAFDNVRVVALTALPLTAQISNPTNGATVNTNFVINASASVFPGTVTNVNFYRGGALLGSDDTAPFAFSVTEAAPGAAALTVVAQDDNGNSATSSVVNVTVSSVVSETIVRVDPSKTWVGYMNVFETPQNFGAYLWGSPWGVSALSAEFSGAGPASVLTLRPAVMGDSSSYWYDYTDLSFPVGTNGAVANKDMEATLYVQPSGLNGNLVTFTGTVITNTLVRPESTNLIGNGWTNVAFIRDFAPDFSTFTETSITLTNGMVFSISLQTIADPNRHIQYGFRTRGPNVWPSDVGNYGAVVLQSLDASPTNIAVNSSAPWVGYMNVFETPQNGSGYLWGSPWGTADLKAVFGGFGLVLSPNNIGDPDPYWYVGGGAPGAVGNKIMDASMYVEIGSLPGRNVTFGGTVLSNTLVSASNTNAAGNGWTSVAFIKDFAPDYSSVNQVSVPLPPGPFSITLYTVNDPARHVQYGFETVGPNVWVTDAPTVGNVIIQNTGVLPTTITPSLNGNTVNLSFPTQLGRGYTVQYKTNLTDGSWNTLTVTNGTGINAVVSDTSTHAQRFYRLSVQ